MKQTNVLMGVNSKKTQEKIKRKMSSKFKIGEAGMHEMKESYNEFIEYLENLDQTVQKVLERHKTLMKGRYLSAFQHLEKVKKNLEAHEEKMLNLQKELNENETIYKIVQQIDNFKSFYKILQEKMKELNTVISFKENESETLLDRMREKKNLLLQVHQENIQNSTKILSYKMELVKIKNQIASENNRESLPEKDQKKMISSSPLLSAQMNIKKIQKDFTALKYEIENANLENNVLKGEFFKKSNNFTITKNLFHECLKTLNKSLFLQEKVTNQTGLKNSLLFKINKISDGETKISKTLNVFKKNEKSNLQDRQIINVVYSTLQKIVKEKKNKKKNILEKLDLTWEEFNSFSPIQIMGLISMSSEKNILLTKEFEDKQKKLNIFFSKIKIY